LAHSYKICPICETPNHQNAAVCRTCGMALAQVQRVADDDADSRNAANYDHVYGETDLAEGQLRWRGGTVIVGAILTLVALACVVGLLWSGVQALNLVRGTATPMSITPTVLATHTMMTSTPRPTLFLATVTQGPPTPTVTLTASASPTLGPCIQPVLAGDSLISVVMRCGHSSLDVIPAVLELNNLSDASMIQLGQNIEVPWPTPTVDPNVTAETPVASSDSGGSVTLVVDAGGRMVAIVPTETLQPGVMWHSVAHDENIIQIAFSYGANLRILSELNPEITFSQCDFGLGSGGANCVVNLSEGQLVRVPAPTVTPTIQPSPSGSETPTPTATSTFNAPTALMPSDRAFFSADAIVTLRWVATGSISAGQAYLVTARDTTANLSYSATTQELSFILPPEWQAADGARHDYEWEIAVIDTAHPEAPYYVTEIRRFTWQGREGQS
jgi:hypothetical protein